MKPNDLEEWELMAMRAEGSIGIEQAANTNEFNSMLEPYLQSKRSDYNDQLSSVTAGDPSCSSTTDVIDKNFNSLDGGWKSRRRVLNKIIDLHESFDDIDEYGFPLSGPFSLLAMKLRHPRLYDATIGNDIDVSIGSGSSEFGNNFYLNIGLNTNEKKAPFDRGGLVAKLAWGVLQKEIYDDNKGVSSTSTSHQQEKNVTKDDDSTVIAIPSMKHCNDLIQMNDSTIWIDTEEEVEGPLDELNSRLEVHSGSQGFISSNIDIDCLKIKVDVSVDEPIAIQLTDEKSKIRNSYLDHIVDKEEDYEKELRNAERLRRIADGMKVHEHARPQLDNTKSDGLMFLFASEAHYLFVNGQDGEAEDEVRDLLNRNAEAIRDQLASENVINRNRIFEEHYFNE